MNKLTFSVLIVSAFFCIRLTGQSVLLEKDLNESVYLKKKGPNQDKFFHFYFDHSYYAPVESGNIYDPGYSFRNFIGARRYYRLANSYIMGVNLDFGWENFRIKQTSQKTFPSAGVHKKEFLSTTNLGVEYFNRLLLTQKEGSLGVWTDVGFYSNLNLGSRHVTLIKASSTDEVRNTKTINKGLKYLNKFEYGLKARVGYKRYAVLVTYRTSDWIATSNNDLEPSRLSVGFELGVY